jgi:hypothetical protein
LPIERLTVIPHCHNQIYEQVLMEQAVGLLEKVNADIEPELLPVPVAAGLLAAYVCESKGSQNSGSPALLAAR